MYACVCTYISRAPPDVQPSTGCVEFGCWSRGCGCDVGTGRGCWGTDMRGAIALVQRGVGVGEDVVIGCTFSDKIRNAEMAGAKAAIGRVCVCVCVCVCVYRYVYIDLDIYIHIHIYI